MLMKITVVTLFPEMIRGFLEESIIKRAQVKGVVSVEIVNLRDFAKDSYGTVDDKPYGGGAGMVLKADVVDRALENSRKRDSHIMLTTPKGAPYNQNSAERLAKLTDITIICGHYEGYDERIQNLVGEEISIGDFVLTGGEIAACAVVDSIVRLLPGTLKKQEASRDESYSEVSIAELQKVVGDHEIIRSLVDANVSLVRLLEYPHYTRPETFQGTSVPSVLLSGHHEEIRKWRLVQAFEETVKRRPDLLNLPKTNPAQES